MDIGTSVFNGIIFYTGVILEIIHIIGSSLCFCFKTSIDLCKALKLGSSVSCSGVCLTVTKIENDCFYVDVSNITLNASKFKFMKIGDLLNFELPLKFNDFIDGHLLQGHVDAIGTVLFTKILENSMIINISVPEEAALSIVNKGSVGVDGVSLTIIEILGNIITVNIIPYTYKNTTLRALKAGDYVNIETDIIGRYVKKMYESHGICKKNT